MSSPTLADLSHPRPTPRLPVEEHPAACTRPVRSPDGLAADASESDQEPEMFLAFTYAERHPWLMPSRRFRPTPASSGR
ncbi:hypothetical protein LRR80_00218 [Streptomyces sp. RO-S4]|nr:hypothetical protein [Streptomyces sp. RO-S4]